MPTSITSKKILFFFDKIDDDREFHKSREIKKADILLLKGVPIQNLKQKNSQIVGKSNGLFGAHNNGYRLVKKYPAKHIEFEYFLYVENSSNLRLSSLIRGKFPEPITKISIEMKRL